MLGQFLFDSAFANGAYSHSFGMESYIAWGKVKSAQSYQEWLTRYMIDVFAVSDGAVYAMAYMLKDKRLSLLKLARVANASISSFECRMGAVNMARATLKNTEFMHNYLARWYANICENERFAHPAIACSVLSDESMASEYAYACIKTLTQNATRAIPLSYKKSSELLHDNIALAKKSSKKSFKIAKELLSCGYFSLKTIDECDKHGYAKSVFSSHQELDIAMFAHEKLDFRLFMS